MTAATIAVPITTSPLVFSRVFVVMRNSPVVLGEGCAGRTVVGAVGRSIVDSVVCDRMLVPVSFATEAEPSCAVPASLLKDDESLIKAVPSARQNFSASSGSTRLHCGQRFTLCSTSWSLVFLDGVVPTRNLTTCATPANLRDVPDSSSAGHSAMVPTKVQVLRTQA